MQLHGLIYAYVYLDILSLPLPIGKFSQDAVIIFGHQRDENDQMFFLSSDFAEFILGQTALTKNGDCLTVVIKI